MKEREAAKRRIPEENPHIAKDALEFMLSLPVEKKIPEVICSKWCVMALVVTSPSQFFPYYHISYNVVLKWQMVVFVLRIV